MGKGKKNGVKANVFKVAGAKSLKKTKTKAVNLGLKNLKQKVIDIDKSFLAIKNNTNKPTQKQVIQTPLKKDLKNVTEEEVVSTLDQINKMDVK